MRRPVVRLALLAALAFLAAACSTAPKRPTEVVERKQRAAEYAVAGNARYARGDYRQALVLFRLALNENIAVDHEEGIAASYNSLGKAHLAMGQLDEAERYFREALRLAERLSDRGLRAQSSSNLGEVCLARGRAAEAEELLEAAVALLPAKDPGPEARHPLPQPGLGAQAPGAPGGGAGLVPEGPGPQPAARALRGGGQQPLHDRLAAVQAGGHRRGRSAAWTRRCATTG